MGRTVDELLLTTTAPELAEWEAYERATGPLGGQYEQDMLAHIHEQLQMLTYVLGAVNTPKGGECPVPEPQKVLRPPQIYENKDDGASSDSESIVTVRGAMGLDSAVEFFEARQQQK